jgi:cyclohexanone monooxygenase
VHGLQTEGFPNAFFMGFNHGAITVNTLQTLNEQAVQVAYMLDQVRVGGGSQIEATPEDEQAWVDKMTDKARVGAKFRAECTPGCYNNEGAAENPNGFFSANYGAGPVRFLRS